MPENAKSKMAYLTYAEMIDKLNNGIIDEYDRVIVTDQNFKEYVISPDLIPVPITGEENDPTVPTWAKQPTKPIYSAEEVGAVDADNEMTFSRIDALFNVVFGG